MTRTAVNQSPSGGNDYPFRQERALNALLLDVFLGYVDGGCAAVWPLRISDLYGFGTGTYTADNARDVIVKDAADNIIFDSTTASYQEVAWGSDRAVAEWYDADGQVLRITFLTSALDDFTTPMTPDAALDPRAYFLLPVGVTALIVNDVSMRETIDIEAGYNVALTAESPERVDGGEFVERITLDGVVGAGAGRLAGCEEVEPVIRKINNIGPDSSGNLIVETVGCIRQQLLLTNDAVYAASGMSESEAMAALKLEDHCAPCCPCDAYVYVYRGLKRVWDKWAVLAQQLEAIRDTYADSRQRWLAQRDCRLEHPVRLLATPQHGSTLFVGAVYCNMSHCCLAPLEIRFTLTRYVDGVAAGGVTGLVVREAKITGHGTPGEIAYAPDVVDNVIIFRFDNADAQRSTSIRLRACYAAEENDTVLTTVTVHAPDPPPNSFGEVCVLPTPDLPTDWAETGIEPVGPLRAVASQLSPVITSERTFPCTQCDC